MTDDLAEELRRVRERLDSLERRVSELEPERDRQSGSAPKEETGASRDAATEPGAPDAAAAAATDDTVSEDRTADAAASGPEADSDESARDWEQDVGIRWLGIAGGVALVLGVVFFVQVAIDRGLLGPLARVAVGTVGGLLLLATGRLLAQRRGYVRWGRIAAGTGLAIAYFSLYASYEFESYRQAIGTPLPAVVLLLTLLIAGAVGLSVRDEAPVVAAEAFFLGYLTAVLGLDAGSGVLTPAYVVLLVAGLAVLASVRGWSLHLLASVLASYAVLGLWLASTGPDPVVQLASFAAVFLAYVAGGYALAAGVPEGRASAVELGLLTASNATFGALFLELSARSLFSDAPVEGVAVGVVAAVVFGSYLLTDRRAASRDDVAGAVAVPLAGGSVLLAAGTFASTVGLLTVVLAAVALSRVLEAPAFRSGAHLLLAATVYKVVTVDASALPAFDAGDPLATATGRPAAFVLAIAVTYGLAWWWSREEPTHLVGVERDLRLAAPYAWLGTGLTVLSLALELDGLGISVSWAVFGLALVVAGLAREVRGLRIQGIAVLALATAKVFLVDTSDLDLLARALSALVLGAILLVASFGYARWQGADPLEQLSED